MHKNCKNAQHNPPNLCQVFFLLFLVLEI